MPQLKDILPGTVQNQSLYKASASTASISSSSDLNTIISGRAVGFNYYSLMTEIIFGVQNLPTKREANLNYIVSSGASLVRVAFSAFSSNDSLARVHNTSVMPETVSTDNLKPTFIAACDTAMDALAAKGLKCLITLFWGQTFIPGAFSETPVYAYGNLNSKTSIYCKSFARWFCQRYYNHKAVGLFSIGNEYTVDATGVSNPTATQLSLWFKFIADEIKSVIPKALVTSDITSPPINLSRTKETLAQAIDRYRTIFKYLDVYNLHIYNDDYSFTGHCNAEGVSVAQNAIYSPLGYEGVESLARAYHEMALADNKPLIFGEVGVNENNETSDSSNTWYDKKKKIRLLKAVVPYASVTLIWNVQDSEQAATANQTSWVIDPQLLTNKRAEHFLDIAKSLNYGKLRLNPAGIGNPATRLARSPDVCMRINDRTAGKNINFVTTAAHASASGYSIAFRIRLDGPLNNAETLLDFRNGTTSGFVLLALLQANALSFYSDARYASGSGGNTNNVLPDFVVSEWNHVCINHCSRVINSIPVVYTEIWLNGIYWHSIVSTALPASVPTGTTVYIMGNAGNGVPMRMQDIAVFPSALSNSEIWAHINGEVSPRSLTHVRAFNSGEILDISKNSVALVLNGATVGFG